MAVILFFVLLLLPGSETQQSHAHCSQHCPWPLYHIEVVLWLWVAAVLQGYQSPNNSIALIFVKWKLYFFLLLVSTETFNQEILKVYGKANYKCYTTESSVQDRNVACVVRAESVYLSRCLIEYSKKVFWNQTAVNHSRATKSEEWLEKEWKKKKLQRNGDLQLDWCPSLMSENV